MKNPFSGLFRARDKPGRRPSPQNALNGSAFSFMFGRSAAGKLVNERSAMQMSAVYACVRVLSEAIASMPLHFYRYNDTGGTEKATDHPLYRLLHDEPNPEMSAYSYRETSMIHLLLYGNAFSQVIRNRRGEITAIYPLMPDRIIRSHAHVFTTSSGSHKIPVVTSKGSASWVDEEGQIPDSDDVFGQKLIGAHKVATRIKVSEELLNDSAFDLEGYFVSEFGRRIGNKEEEAFFTGNGSGKPTGILDGTAGADIGVTTTSASAITADEIIDLFYSLNVPYRKDAIWILNDSTLKAVRKLKDGTGQYLWQPALHEGSFDTLLGKRIFVSPYMPEIASGAKTVAFGDFKFYWIGDRQGITFRRLNELYAENGQVGFIASKRVDGKLILPEAIKVLKQKT